MSEGIRPGKQKPIASETFTVRFEEEEHEYRLDLYKAEAFQYGNGTCVAVFRDGEFEEQLDMRYEKNIDSPEAFHDWAGEYLTALIHSKIVIKQISK